MKAKSYDERLREFVAKDCTGKQYDSCCNSPCRFSSVSGCTHPQHPKRATQTELCLGGGAK